MFRCCHELLPCLARITRNKITIHFRFPCQGAAEDLDLEGFVAETET